jgi:ADP-ribose pyrophosphatase YjhB (NUDIX family)
MNKRSEIHNLEDLIRWLDRFNIPFQDWGKNQTKTVQHLFNEIINGECWLMEDQALRRLSVVQALIYQNGFILVEKEQILCDARVRNRLAPPSEKLKAGETWQTALIRCLEEELELEADQVLIVSEDIKARTRSKVSISYPGLKSRYYLYQAAVTVPGLPQEDFWTAEKSEPEAEPLIEKHRWGWVSPETINLNSGRSIRESD